MAEAIGCSPGEMWELMCMKYFGYSERELFGVKYMRPLRTTTLDQHGKRSVLNYEEMSNFVHFCESEAASHGIQLSSEDNSDIR